MKRHRPRCYQLRLQKRAQRAVYDEAKEYLRRHGSLLAARGAWEQDHQPPLEPDHWIHLIGEMGVQVRIPEARS